MSTHLHGTPIRVLTIGASETNRRRVPSMGEVGNQVWARELERRYQVLGCWPTFLMHHLDARADGRSPPSMDDLCGFGRGRYLYDRRRAYRWRHAELWNVGIPGSVAQSGLFYLRLHKERLRAFAPDVIALCLGSVDCMELTTAREAEDLCELAAIPNMDPAGCWTFNYLRDADDFHGTLTEIAEVVAWIGNGAVVAHLDLIVGGNLSRRQRELVSAFNDTVRDVGARFDHRVVSHPFLGDGADADRGHWFRADDNHPTDAMNEAVALHVLACLPPHVPRREAQGGGPKKTINVIDWTEEDR